MRKLIFILIVFLILFSLGMIVLYGASGHRMNFQDFESIMILFFIFLFLFTAITLLIFNYKKSGLVRKISLISIFFTLMSFIYFFYEILKVKIGDFFALIPIMILIAVFILSIKVLYYLFNYKTD